MQTISYTSVFYIISYIRKAREVQEKKHLKCPVWLDRPILKDKKLEKRQGRILQMTRNCFSCDPEKY